MIETKKLGKLKAGDTFFKINWEGGHIESVEACVITDTVDLKIGRMLHYGDHSKNEFFGVTVEFKEYELDIMDGCFQTQICSDKDLLLEILDNDLEEFQYNNCNMRNYIKNYDK